MLKKSPPGIEALWPSCMLHIHRNGRRNLITAGSLLYFTLYMRAVAARGFVAALPSFSGVRERIHIDQAREMPDKMQVCDYCKTENNDDHKYCKECGNRLQSLVAVEIENIDEAERLDIESMKGKAFIHSVRGQHEQAVNELVRAIRHHPHVPELHYQLGNIYYKNVQVENAIKELERCISLDPGHFKALLTLGNIYGEDVRNHNMAIRIYKMAVGLKPDYPDLRNNLGNALRFKGRFEEAAEQFRRAIELNPNYARAMFNLGKTYYSMKDFDMAEELYRKAIEIDRNHPRTYMTLGLTLRAQGRDDEAVEQFRTATELDPSFVQAYAELARALDALGRSGEAAEAAGEALKIQPALGSVEAILNSTGDDD